MIESKLSNITKEELEKLILKEKLSYEEIGRKYEVSGVAIKKKARKLEIKLPKKRKINSKETFNKGVSIKSFNKNKISEKKRKKSKTRIAKTKIISYCKNCGKEFIQKSKTQKYCCSGCSSKGRSKEKYENYLENSEIYQGQENMRWIKSYILEEQNHKCDICGLVDSWNDKPITFILDHIDGHSNNNKRDNLRLIYPNCDSQLETFKSKNRKSDRSNRSRYYSKK